MKYEIWSSSSKPTDNNLEDEYIYTVKSYEIAMTIAYLLNEYRISMYDLFYVEEVEE